MSDSISPVTARRDTWRRRHRRCDAQPTGDTVSVMSLTPPREKLADLIVALSRGRISSKAARDVAFGGGHTTVEIVVDPQTGFVARWSMRTKFSSRGDGGPIAPAA